MISTDALINILGLLMITSILIFSLTSIQEKASKKLKVSLLEWKAAQSQMLIEAYLLGDNMEANLSTPCTITPDRVICSMDDITIVKEEKHEKKGHA